MPGYADWRGLYAEEYLASGEEGYALDGLPKPEATEAGEEAHERARSDAAGQRDDWKQLYFRLFEQRSGSPRPGYRYVEPNGFADILTAAPPVPTIVPVSESGIEAKVRGAWLGRASGVVLGKPLEMGWNREKIRAYLESCAEYPVARWVPASAPELGIETRRDCLPSTRGNVSYVQPDDDIHYTILALRLVEKHGLAFTHSDVGRNWLENIPYHWVWCASRQAYMRMVADDALDDPALMARIPYELNPWRECIDGQIRSDFWGYFFAGDPRGAAEYAHRDCSFSLIKNGVYGGMFVAAAIASAFAAAPTVETIIEAGLSVVPVESRFAEMVHKVRSWYRSSSDWSTTCAEIERAYGHLPFAATINNMAVVVLALLHGDLDYTKTITTAVMCGFDTDCNAGTAGSIVGAAVGPDAIDRHWTDPLNDTVKTVVADVGQTSLTELIARTLAARKKVR